MISYIKNTELSMRLGLNPCNWVWIPSIAYEKPSIIYPKRRTFAIAWLGVQFYLDIDNGEVNMTPLNDLMSTVAPWNIEETEVD